MKLSQRSNRSNTINVRPINARGMSKVTALLMLFPLALIEFTLFLYMVAYGAHSVGLALFIFSFWNLGACFSLTFYILLRRHDQQQGYMEVSNYINLNKISGNKF